MFLRTKSRGFLVVLSLMLLAGCGRTELHPGAFDDETREPVPPPCAYDTDCPQTNLCAPMYCDAGSCVARPPVQCEQPEPCMVYACNPQTGGCEGRESTQDLDGDGFKGPLPGFDPREAEACGNDCDDTNFRAFPGGVEYCDGADNDCDGVIDNDSQYLSSGSEDIPELTRVASEQQESSGRRGIAFGDDAFAIGYWAGDGANLPYLRGLDRFGESAFEEQGVSSVFAPSFGPDLAWSGAAFGAVWDDARVDDNYEIYFARFDSSGAKLGPDVRVTEGADFSIHGRVLFDQGRYLIVWDDRRDEDVNGGPMVYGQIVSAEGNLIGGNLALTTPGVSAEYPALAATTRSLGVVYTSLASTNVELQFQAFDKNFGPKSAAVLLVERDVRAPQIHSVGDLFVVSWDVYGDGPGETVMGVVLTEDGVPLAGPVALTEGGAHSRTHDIVSLGDRMLLFWSDDQSGNYELYAKVLDMDLQEIEPRRQLTDDPADTVGPIAAVGEAGMVGVVFDDWRSGKHQSYFLTVGCGALNARD